MNESENAIVMVMQDANASASALHAGAPTACVNAYANAQ